MKKNLTAYLAIFASLVFAFSCAKEEGGQEVPITPDTITVSLSLDENDDENNKSEFTDSRGLQWTNTDVLRWISADGTKTATSTNISITDGGYKATFTIEIPGLSGADQTGHFTVNSEDNGSFKFTKSGLSGTDMTIAQEEIGKMNSAYTFLHSGKDITITKGTTSLTDDQAKLAMAGSIIRAIPYTTTHNSEKVLSIGICSNDDVAGTIAYSYTTSGSTSSGITADQAKKYLVNLTAPFSLEGVTDKNSSHAIYIPVPTTTIGGYRITVETDQAYYMFESDDNLVLTENKVRNVSLNLDNSAVTPSSKKEKITLAASNISTNDPMQYVAEGQYADQYGLNGGENWFTNLDGTKASARMTKYGKAENMWDNNLETCYHLNRDWGKPYTSCTNRDYKINTNREEKRYLQITLPTAASTVDLSFTNADSGKEAEGYAILTSADGSNFSATTYSGSASTSFGATNNLTGLTCSNGPITAIRIQNTRADASWTYIESAFGIAELEIYGYGVKEPAYVRHVKSVSVSPDSKTLDVTENVQLTATVLPENATDKSVTWSSSDNNVATVSNTGLVTANAGGTATITATSVDGGIKATCNITVNTPVSPHKTFTVNNYDATGGQGYSEMQLLCSGEKRIKWNRYPFTSSGSWENYLEIIQGGKSYYISNYSAVQSLSNINSISVAEATDQAGEKGVIPCSGQSGALYVWVTDDGGWMNSPLTIAANTEMSFRSSWDWSGKTDGVSSSLEKGHKYLSIIYEKESSSCKWKILEVSETKPE